MKAIKINAFGDVNVMQLVQETVPAIADNEVLIEMIAAGVNPIDYKICEGSSFAAAKFKDRFPIGLGYDVSGRIVAIGNQAKKFKIGDVVCGMVGFPDHPACYADYVAAKEHELSLVPETLDVALLGALPLAALTALQALELVGVTAGQRVLIQAAAGGVGHIAVQLAKLKGAYVIATASKHNHDFLTHLGVDHCIDYHTEDFLAAAGKVDIVLDAMGGQVGIKSLDALKPHGKLVSIPSISFNEIEAAAKEKGVTALKMIVTANVTQLDFLVNLVHQGQLELYISQRLPLEQAAKAHELLAAKHTKGKIILT